MTDSICRSGIRLSTFLGIACGILAGCVASEADDLDVLGKASVIAATGGSSSTSSAPSAGGAVVPTAPQSDAPEAAGSPSAGGSSITTQPAQGGATASGGSSSSSTSSGALKFEIKVPGSDAAVPARVETSKSTGLEILGYPQNFEFPIAYGILPATFDGAFSQTFCNKIAKLVKLAASNESFKEQIARMVRSQGALTAIMPISSLVGPNFADIALRTAHQAGGTAAARIENPLELDDVTATLELSPDAMSNYLGDVEELEENVSSSLIQQADIAYLTGEFSVSIGAKDLWCDLAYGKATLHLAVSGTSSSASYKGTTLLKGVVPAGS
ncbi:MAG: hypothetical protein ACM3ZE_05665 [Myxococcales bacterium]